MTEVAVVLKTVVLPVGAVNVPLLVKLPPTVNEAELSMVKVAPVLIVTLPVTVTAAPLVSALAPLFVPLPTVKLPATVRV